MPLQQIDDLPPLEWLRVFEAAGRLGNFTAAARELGLTQAAVSQRIRNLEGRLGVRLFRRLARGVELTADGDAYLPHVTSALAAMRRGTQDLFGAPRRRVSIAAAVSVAALWITPRLKRLTETHPSLQVSIFAIHRLADFEAVQADYEMQFGNGDWPERDGVRLYEEALAPACAPELLRSIPDGDWRRLPVIAVTGPRDGWREWAESTQEAPVGTPALRFDSFITALEAARSGVGVLLASLPLSHSALTDGSLVLIDTPTLRMSSGTWLTWRRDDRLDASHEAIAACLTNPTADAGPSVTAGV